MTQNSDANFGIEGNYGGLWKNANNQRGQTYFSLEGIEWFDVKDLETEIGVLNQANVCLKAFTEETSLGDVNLDEHFDLIDLSTSVQYFSNNIKDLPEEAMTNLDMNQDENIDLMDLSKMVLILANYN